MTFDLLLLPALAPTAFAMFILDPFDPNPFGVNQDCEAAAAECRDNPPPFLELPAQFPDRWEHSQQLLPVVARQLPDFPRPTPLPIPTFENGSPPPLNADFLDRRHFWNMLVTIIPQSPFAPMREQPVRILDIGCGRALDAMPLHAYFGRSSPGMPGTHVSYLGIDIDPEAIGMAKLTNPERSDLQFLVADATAYNKYSSLKDPVDVVVIRHQAIGFDMALWSKILKEALHHLAEGGILLMTSHIGYEHQLALARLKSLRARIHLSGRNPFARRFSAGYGIDFQDQYVAVVTKQVKKH